MWGKSINTLLNILVPFIIALVTLGTIVIPVANNFIHSSEKVLKKTTLYDEYIIYKHIDSENIDNFIEVALIYAKLSGDHELYEKLTEIRYCLMLKNTTQLNTYVNELKDYLKGKLENFNEPYEDINSTLHELKVLLYKLNILLTKLSNKSTIDKMIEEVIGET